MNLKMFGAIALAALIASPVLAADDTANKKKGKRGQQNAATQILKQLEDLKLTDDQVAKIKEMGKEASAAMKKMRDDAGITAAVIKKRTEAQQAMKDSELKGKELMAAVNEKAGITEAQANALKTINEARMKFQKSVVGLLTDEQKEKLPARLKRSANAGKGKKSKGQGKKKSDA